MRREDYMDMFFDMMHSNYGLFRWEYDPYGNLLDTNCHWPEPYEKLFIFTACKDYTMIYFAEHDAPLLLSAPLGMEWAAAKSPEGHIFIMGPGLLSNVSDENLVQTLKSYSPIVARTFSTDFIGMIRTLPVIVLSSFQNLLLMLTYAVTGKQYKISDIHYQNEHPVNTNLHSSFSIQEEPRLDQEEENKLLHWIETGNTASPAVINRSFIDRFRTSLQLDPTPQNIKYAVALFGILCARAAIKGGLLPENAYAISGFYVQNVNSCRNIDEAVTVAQTLYSDFLNRVDKCRELPGSSREIHDCCKYIRQHIQDKLSVSELASRFGYTDYYFTHKFKIETGQSMSGYIKQQKIEYAAFLLTNTNTGIQDVSDMLHFSNRNVFSAAFRQIMGCSPAAYREQNKY